MPLDPAERLCLLGLARAQIRRAARGEGPSDPEEPSFEALRVTSGAFVSLHREGFLRGCLGTVVGRQPLYLCVARMAHAAATRDPRFDALEPGEDEKVDIEISVLSALCPARPEEVEVGRHGVQVGLGSRVGLLLPQVALEMGWDRATLLDQVCRKARLPPGSWRLAETDLRVFTAEVFGERDHGS